MGDEIAELKRKVAAARDALTAAERDLDRALQNLAPVKVGDVVRHRGALFKVLEIEAREWRPEAPWLICAPQRADGSFGTKRRRLFDGWEHVG